MNWVVSVRLKEQPRLGELRMSTATLNTFPAINTFQLPRGWFLAIIVVLHVGFFFALNNGLSFSTLIFQPPPFQVTEVNPETREIIDRPVLEPDFELSTQGRVTPGPLPDLQFGEDEGPISDPKKDFGGPAIPRGDESTAGPVIVGPAIPSTGLSEPVYPASEIRAGHTGTALLLLQILPNGRVGEVRLEQSSGFAKLDQSAMREARKWRFVPGTRDGVPVTLWKQVPIKFELHDRK